MKIPKKIGFANRGLGELEKLFIELVDDLIELFSQVNELRTLTNELRGDVIEMLTGDALLSALNLRESDNLLEVGFDNFIVRIDGVTRIITQGQSGFSPDGEDDISDPDTNGRERIWILVIYQGGAFLVAGDQAALGAAVAPATPANHMKLGEIKIAHDGTAPFDAMTDELTAAHLTVTFTDVTVTPLVTAPAVDETAARKTKKRNE